MSTKFSIFKEGFLTFTVKGYKKKSCHFFKLYCDCALLKRFIYEKNTNQKAEKQID